MRITKEPWFGPKTGFGWGWTPITWQGWLVTGVCLAVIIWAVFFFRGGSMAIYITFGAVAALILACILTGTAPG